MELRAAINDFKNALKFVKPLAKIVDHFELIDKLEGREQELKSTMSFLKSDYDDMVGKHNDFEAKLVLKQERVSGEIAKIENMVHTKKVEAFEVLNGEVAEAQKVLNTINAKIESSSLSLSELGREEADLKDKVKALKKVIAEVSGVKGVE